MATGVISDISIPSTRLFFSPLPTVLEMFQHSMRKTKQICYSHIRCFVRIEALHLWKGSSLIHIFVQLDKLWMICLKISSPIAEDTIICKKTQHEENSCIPRLQCSWGQHGVNIGPIWVLSAPDGPHIGPMNIAIRVFYGTYYTSA